ncbi:hypothetical protein B0H16DRAFT_1721950 [Mycena metata]|uniref:Uncharacterized protein n=1 Tax=Mycena metata TaxID=1033252 RepID=A0AAD7J4T1_9AGAR|nr:hypothetical protein B0H16DRAFT_1721950 [Mycena metata]
MEPQKNPTIEIAPAHGGRLPCSWSVSFLCIYGAVLCTACEKDGDTAAASPVVVGGVQLDVGGCDGIMEVLADGPTSLQNKGPPQ